MSLITGLTLMLVARPACAA